MRFSLVYLAFFPGLAFLSGLHADGASAVQGFDIRQFVPIILIMAVAYFMLIRPQQKKAKEHQAMINTLRKGDKVITAGGIIAVVNNVISDNELEININNDVKVRVVRSTVNAIAPIKGSSTINASSPNEKAKIEVQSAVNTPKAAPKKNAPTKKAVAQKNPIQK